MKILICGGRDFNDYDKLRRILDELASELGEISEVIEGGARGADALGRRWAEENKIPVRTFNASWLKYGKAAGPIRNQQMLDEGRPDIVVAFPGGTGTSDMVKRSISSNLEVRCVSY